MGFFMQRNHNIQRNHTMHRRKIWIFFLGILICMCILFGRIIYLMIFRGEYYSKNARDLQERERAIKAARGNIIDRNGVVLAANESVCTISVIHNHNAQKTQKAATKQSVRDQLQISQAGRDYQIAKKAVSEASDVREDKVAKLKSMVDSGAYNVEPGDFASKLLEKYNQKL